jgi:multidrug efflux system membrane fusion protein
MRLFKWIFLFLPLIIASCSKQGPIEKPSPPVIVQTIKTQSIPFFVDTLGHFVAFNTVNIQAQVQGVLTGLYFEEGQSVKAGDLLFTIDKAPYQAVLNKAVATLRENQATLAYNLTRQERYSGLVEENYVSKLQYTQYVTELESQQALIEANKADIESAAINVGYCSLFSPIDGVTGKRLIDVGNVITDVGSKLLVINQITPLFIYFSIPER